MFIFQQKEKTLYLPKAAKQHIFLLSAGRLEEERSNCVSRIVDPHDVLNVFYCMCCMYGTSMVLRIQMTNTIGKLITSVCSLFDRL